MNIFATSPCPVESALYLDPVRANKMLLESAQILSSAIWLNGGRATYKLTHRSNKIILWASESQGNYKWLLDHLKALCRRFRDDRGKMHKSEGYLPEYEEGIKYIPIGKRTPFVNCARNREWHVDFTYIEDTHEAYRRYLDYRWRFTDPPNYGHLELAKQRGVR